MRLVSLCPSLTELVFDLGAGEHLVGRTRFCVHPEGDVDRVERVGGTKNPRIERIIQLAPDLVLMNEEENRLEDAAALREAGIRVHSSMPQTVSETAAMVREISDILGEPERGREVATAIRSEGDRVAALAAGRPAVRYAYLIWRNPLMAAGGSTFIDGVLSAAGGSNVFAGAEDRYPTLSPEGLAEAAPDAVLLSSEPYPFLGSHAEELAAETGLPRERFRLVDGELLSWHGSRTVAGLRYAGELMASIRGS